VIGIILAVSAMVQVNAREQICHPERKFHTSILSGEQYRSIQYMGTSKNPRFLMDGARQIS
jgi:hypothetical protein